MFCVSNFALADNPISLPTQYIPQPFDVIHYDATIDLRKGMSKQIFGVCNIFFVWTQNPENKSFYFHLRSLRVDSVFYRNQKVSFTEKSVDTLDYKYFVVSNLNGQENDTVVLSIYYSGTATNEGGTNPFGGIFLIDSVLFAIGVGFQNDYVSATQHWLPCYDHPSDKATFRFKFLYPSGFQIATNGIVESTGEIDDTTKFLITSSKYPIATYLMTFAMGKFKKMQLDTLNMPSKIATEVFYLPEDEEAVQFAFNNFAKYFYSLQNAYGKYPFEKIGYVIVPFDKGAMEHQTMITFPRNYPQYLFANKDTNNIMALHELSHQWFGNSVSPLDFRDAWFNESFATFSESLYLERVVGKEAYLRDLLLKKNYYINSVAKKEGLLPLYNYPRKQPSSNYPSTIYVKGAVVVGMLRYLLGDIMFFDLIRNYLDLFSFQSRSTNDFLNFSVAYTNQNLYWFFEQWIFQPGYPILEIRSTQYIQSQNTSSSIVTIKQVQPESYGRYINIPVELNFRLSNGSSIDTVVILSNDEGTFWFDSLPAFVAVYTNLGRRVVPLYASTVYSTVENTSDIDQDYLICQLDDKIILKRKTINTYSRFMLYDLIGNKLHEGKFNNNEELAEIDINKLRSGVYIIMIKNLDKIYTSKILIKH
ncbi:MAG: M1 family aminopeptidase [Candidatus Kapaibacteriota bacterium]